MKKDGYKISIYVIFYKLLATFLLFSFGLLRSNKRKIE